MGEILQDAYVELSKAMYDSLLAYRDEQHAKIATLTAELDAFALTAATNCHDWANDDTAIRDALRHILGAMVDGDANGVPPLVDLVEQVVGRVREVELAVHACESAQ